MSVYIENVSKDAEGVANSVNPDQTAPFAMTCLSKYLG